MARIFISYRREDSEICLRLVDELRKHLPPEQVFLDIVSIGASADWVEALEEGLSTATVMLAVIGQRWLSATDEQGRRRLDMPGDFVREEIAESLRRPGVRVFPLLVDGAEMPAEEELPEPLKALHRRQAVELRARHWHQDVAQLVQTLKRAPGFSDDRRVDEDFTLQRAEQAAQRREAKERAAKEETQRTAALDRAYQKAEEDARHGDLASGWAPGLDEVHLGAAAPRTVSPGEEFVARFAAYTEAHRSEVRRVIAQEAPSAHPRLDLETCRWRPGAKVTVRLDAYHVKVSNPVQAFKWNGAWCVLRFDAKVPVYMHGNTIILRFDVAVEGFPIIAIRPEIAVSRKEKEDTSVSVIEQTAPSSAFASYAKKDKRDVLGRVRSLQIFTGIDVFFDCLSIRPGEEWKPKLKNEIRDRDIFWLFWSRSAMVSEWVEWEWRTALAEKSLAKIQPHPLEPSELAPPPQELSSLQFGAMYEWYVSQLRESPITRVFRPLLHKAASLIRRW